MMSSHEVHCRQGKKDVGLAPLFEARMILSRRLKACVDDVAEKREYLLRRASLLMVRSVIPRFGYSDRSLDLFAVLQDDLEKERAYRDEQLEHLLMVENLAQSILDLKDEVAALSRETDDIKCALVSFFLHLLTELAGRGLNCKRSALRSG